MMEEDAVVGVTSNPTIFQKAISQGNAYDEQLEGAARARGRPEGDLPPPRRARRRAMRCDLLAPGARAERRGRLRLDRGRPDLAYDTETTYEEAIRLHEWIARPNLYVKIPGDRAGPAGDRGLHRRRHAASTSRCSSRCRCTSEAMEAYLRGLERLVDGGGDASQVRSVASFFVSRVDTEADKRLEAIGSDEALALRGKLAIANATHRVPALPAGSQRRALGGARGARARCRSGACGLPPPRRTPSTATSSTSRS